MATALSTRLFEVSPAARTAAIVLAVAVATILAALAFEHIWGYAPCHLCLQQRYAYYAGIPLLAGSLWAIAADRRGLAIALLFAVSLAFLANAWLGTYQAGAEWKFWDGPESCSGTQTVSTKAGDLLKRLPGTRAIRCDEASWRFAGLSFAGWNVVISLLLSSGALVAAFQARNAPRA